MPTFTDAYLAALQQIKDGLCVADIEKLAQALAKLRDAGGRLFFIGVGGSAATCSHAVNDFRKLGGIEAYTPVDNVAELTANTNDIGWDSVFTRWLQESHLSAKDAVFVFSVGGGDVASQVSVNIVSALQHAKSVRARIYGVVGRTGGRTKELADICIMVPTVDVRLITPFVESVHSIVLHLLVSHPLLRG